MKIITKAICNVYEGFNIFIKYLESEIQRTSFLL